MKKATTRFESAEEALGFWSVSIEATIPDGTTNEHKAVQETVAKTAGELVASFAAFVDDRTAKARSFLISAEGPAAFGEWEKALGAEAAVRSFRFSIEEADRDGFVALLSRDEDAEGDARAFFLL